MPLAFASRHPHWRSPPLPLPEEEESPQASKPTEQTMATESAANSPDMAWRRPDPCLASESYEPLAALSPGLAVAQIPAGSYILAHTAMSVLAAPYHRDNHGNRLALDILRSPPALAEGLARKAGAKYVLLCWATPADIAALQAMGADSLAARLSTGGVPRWLRPTHVEDAIFHSYEIVPSSE